MNMLATPLPLSQAAVEQAIRSARPLVIRRLLEAGCGGEVDSALQQVREVLWRREADFDPELGTLDAYARGVARNVVRSTVRASSRHCTDVELPHDDAGPAVGTHDPLETLVESFTHRRLLEYVADTVSARDWEIATAFALDDDATPSVVAARFELSERQIRASRAWVRQVGSTARAAISAAEQGETPERATLLNCIPDSDGLRTVAVFVPALQHAVSVIASQTGLSEGRVRSRLPRARTLLQLAERILRAESS